MPTKQADREQRVLERLQNPERPRHHARRPPEDPVRVVHDGRVVALESQLGEVGGEAHGGPHLHLQQGARPGQPVVDARSPRGRHQVIGPTATLRRVIREAGGSGSMELA